MTYLSRLWSKKIYGFCQKHYSKNEFHLVKCGSICLNLPNERSKLRSPYDWKYIKIYWYLICLFLKIKKKKLRNLISVPEVQVNTTGSKNLDERCRFLANFQKAAVNLCQQAGRIELSLADWDGSQTYFL